MYLSVHFSIHPSIHLSIRLFTYLFIYPCIYISIYLSVYFYFCFNFYLSLCLTLPLSPPILSVILNILIDFAHIPRSPEKIPILTVFTKSPNPSKSPFGPWYSLAWMLDMTILSPTWAPPHCRAPRPRLQNFPRQPLPRNDSGLASEARRSRLARLAALVRPTEGTR